MSARDDDENAPDRYTREMIYTPRFGQPASNQNQVPPWLNINYQLPPYPSSSPQARLLSPHYTNSTPPQQVHSPHLMQHPNQNQINSPQFISPGPQQHLQIDQSSTRTDYIISQAPQQQIHSHSHQLAAHIFQQHQTVNSPIQQQIQPAQQPNSMQFSNSSAHAIQHPNQSGGVPLVLVHSRPLNLPNVGNNNIRTQYRPLILPNYRPPQQIAASNIHPSNLQRQGPTCQPTNNCRLPQPSAGKQINNVSSNNNSLRQPNSLSELLASDPSCAFQPIPQVSQTHTNQSRSTLNRRPRTYSSRVPRPTTCTVPHASATNIPGLTLDNLQTSRSATNVQTLVQTVNAPTECQPPVSVSSTTRAPRLPRRPSVEVQATVEYENKACQFDGRGTMINKSLSAIPEMSDKICQTDVEFEIQAKTFVDRASSPINFPSNDVPVRKKTTAKRRKQEEIEVGQPESKLDFRSDSPEINILE